MSLGTLYDVDPGLGPNLDVDIDIICAVSITANLAVMDDCKRIFHTKGMALQVAAVPIGWQMSARFAGNKTCQ